MPLTELLRFLRDKATTPSRIVGVVSAYLAYALYPSSPVYSEFLTQHSALVGPVAGLGICWWLVKETWDYIVETGRMPATQRDLYEMRGGLSTITGRQVRLADTIGEPYWETDATGRMIFSNHANARLYGATARQLLRSGTAPYIHKDDLQDAYRAFKQAIDGKMGFSIEFEVVDRGVYRHTVRVYAWPLFDEDDVFEGHYGSAEIIEDIDDGNS